MNFVVQKKIIFTSEGCVGKHLLIGESQPLVGQDEKKRAVTCDFQQCGILTSVDSDKPVQPP